MTKKIPNKSLLRHIPKVDSILEHAAVKRLFGSVPELTIKAAVRSEIDRIRSLLLEGKITDKADLSLDTTAEAAVHRILKMDRPNLRHVINATGVVIHTNLGRSPLSDDAIRQVAMAARGYSNLEYDIEGGQRGSRDDLVEELICRLTGAEAATVVNNNAAAVMLVLRTMASGKAVVVSRGELVEIGGSFRIPDVMEASGAQLAEVGTTNRTRISDYRKRITAETGLLLKVHTSNYRIVGFAEEASVEELAALGKEHDLPVAVDLGSGCLVDLRELGLKHSEPTVRGVLAQGAKVVTFSGDKLLGGPQAGIIVGTREYLQAIKNNPMKRALRVGKLTLAALESVLKAYLDPATVVEKIPTLRMMAAKKEAVAARARRLGRRLSDLPVRISTLSSVSRVGGGSLPLEELPTMLLALDPEEMSAHDLEGRLRLQDPPVIARIVDDRLCLDLRTVQSRQLGDLEKAIIGALLNAKQ
ncbi:MAG: L-seryl-tRNA(Sec) selenium transferase [bacterium]|nr:L-seryl-tRNA(Sec) selenium transferase [bacterium]MDT8366081.1 L-seryl-tRNA(Sec) selenium transferase [bacterium]